MPNVSVTLKDIGQSVTRPAIIDIVGQLQDITKITKEAKIFFAGDMQIMQNAGTDIDGTNQNRFPIFDAQQIVFITVDEKYNEDALGTTIVSGEEQIPVFEDPRVGSLIRPVYAKSDVSIDFRYRTPSKTEAERWLADMRMRISMLRDINLHDITYHFGLPEVFYEIVENIYDNRNAVEPYGDSLLEYFNQHSTERMTLITDQVGKNFKVVIAETQCRIIGMFDYAAMPEKPTRDESTGTWNVTFTYKFNYEKPIGCNMVYPIIVHNQLLDPKFIAYSDKTHDPSFKAKVYSKSLYALSYFESDSIMNAVNPPDPYFRIPRFDDYILPQILRGSGTSFTALCSVGQDKKSLLNLKELGEIILDDDIMQFIEEVEYPYICQMYKSVIDVELYIDKKLQSNGSLTCDSALNITATSELNLRKQHRVRFGLITDLTLLPKEAIDRLLEYPKAMLKIVSSMNEILAGSQRYQSLGDKGKLSQAEFSDIYAVMTGYTYNNGTIGRSAELYNRNPNAFPIYQSIDPRVLENYRRNRITRKTVQNSAILSYRK